MFCKNCGKEMADNAAACPNCGAPVGVGQGPVGEKSWTTALLLCIFLGSLGVHSFYVGKTGVGVIQLLTCGGCGIWTLIDLITMITGSYRDGEGKALRRS